MGGHSRGRGKLLRYTAREQLLEVFARSWRRSVWRVPFVVIAAVRFLVRMPNGECTQGNNPPHNKSLRSF
jgi:hypothetical protein